MPKFFFTVLFIVFLFTSNSFSAISIDIETGGVFSGYNDVRIPSNTGTNLSLSEELNANKSLFIRFRGTYTFKDKHNISILFAPLSIKADGSVNKDVNFESVLFPKNNNIDAKYKFNSYRLTYRYDFFHKDRFKLGLGLTAKIRDAEISLKSGNLDAKKSNIGFVPLINWQFEIFPLKEFGFIFEGDAFGVKQGRAEDFLVAFQYRVNNNLKLKLGYRMLEGGADVEEVYNFALFNYLVLGGIIEF